MAFPGSNADCLFGGNDKPRSRPRKGGGGCALLIDMDALNRLSLHKFGDGLLACLMAGMQSTVLANGLFAHEQVLRFRLIDSLRQAASSDEVWPMGESATKPPPGGWRLRFHAADDVEIPARNAWMRRGVTALYTPQPGSAWLLGLDSTVSFEPGENGRAEPPARWHVSATWLAAPGNWLLGSTFRRLWSNSPDGGANEDLFAWRYYINYRLPNDWYLVSSPEIRADLNASPDERWTVPVGGGIGRYFDLGGVPLDASLQGYYNLSHPASQGDWSLRLQLRYSR